MGYKHILKHYISFCFSAVSLKDKVLNDNLICYL